ncbi:MAG: alcohol dehydrogenase catalytic domain-containing protein [Candidatus Sumerlaeia bacterium]|nr:alcohol dehydrogenase catalytic domain-containing protein [Candidatus Sumerlaeia bacterium]
MPSLPATQFAVQLVGPGEIVLNRDKPVPTPGPTQFVARVEAVGLCFSDLKLLKQFSAHVRKSEVVAGIAPEVLATIPGYVPGTKPTVPGHEVVCEVVAVGDAVRHHQVGRRYLVQPDYRCWPTAGANAAFGYNFEGALQEFVLFDERIVVEPGGERYLIPIDEHLGSSQAALAEPWACVEDSYVTAERQTIAAGGRLLVVADPGHAIEGLVEAFSPDGPPAEILAIAPESQHRHALAEPGLSFALVGDPSLLPDEGFDDIVYFGVRPAMIEALNPKLAARAIMNVVTGGARIGVPVSVGVGRMHYGLTRWIGTTGPRAAEAYSTIPRNGEIRDGDSILVVGAGGPMGQMHVLRALCSGRRGLVVTATDFDDERLAALARKAEPAARANGCTFRAVNTQAAPVEGTFDYITIMAPVAQLVADAIAQARPGGVVNIFAGVPAPVCHPIDLDRIVADRLFVFGTSGSSLDDMRIVLDKVIAGRLDTDASVDAVSGMAGAIDGIAAVEHRTMAGKIVVYPALRELGLVPLARLRERFPTVADKLDNGQWCRAAEKELLRVGAHS